MAKGTIKSTNTNSGGSSSVGITITPPGGQDVGGSGPPQKSSNPPGQVMTGQLQDNQNPNIVIQYSQPFGIELGLAVGMKVNYQAVSVNGVQIANCVRPLQRGEIQSIGADNSSGTLLDKATGATIPFAQQYCAEQGLVATQPGTKGSMVHFETVIDPSSAQVTAVALEIIGG